MKRLLFITLGCLCLCALPVWARVNVVTLPGRDTVQLTIYNSADLTLVKETRALTFRKGVNKLEFSWAGTLIDPTSVEFRALSNADKVEVLDVSFPPRVTNTLEWRINSEVAGEVVCEIRYFTSGITWGADYVAEADKLEKLMTLAGNVRVTNNSGEDYENAQIRLVVGVIRLVEEIRQLAQGPQQAARRFLPMTTAPAPPARAAWALGRVASGFFEAAPAEIVKEGVSEYFIYTVGGRDTIPTGWSKRLPSFSSEGVKITSYYKFEREQWGDQVCRFYKFKNDKESKLGDEPLPDGAVKAFRFVTPDRLYAFVGATNVKYIPVGEEVELNLGNDREVMVQPKLMNWEKVDLRFNQHGDIDGWTTKETWEFEIQNSKEIPVTLDIRRSFGGDWNLKSETPHEKVDATKVKFVLPLQPRQQRKISYEVVTRHGTNATR
jgi:hypothetical protein